MSLGCPCHHYLVDGCPHCADVARRALSLSPDQERLDAANNHRQELVLQLEAVADRAYAAEQRLIVVQGVASKLLARTGARVALETVVEEVNRGLARDLLREQEAHARTRARLEETLQHLEDLQASGRIQSALERATVAVTRRPYDEIAADLEDTIDTIIQEVPCIP